MPCDFSKYPPNWKSHIRPKVLERAGNRCEFCGIKNAAQGYRGESGTFYNVSRYRAAKMRKEFEAKEPGAPKVIKIVLTVAHLDHDITNNDMMQHHGPVLPVQQSNLRALCQKCHLSYDAEHHAMNAAATRQRKAIEGRKAIEMTQLELQLEV